MNQATESNRQDKGTRSSVHICVHASVCVLRIPAGIHPYFMNDKGFGSCVLFLEGSAVIHVHFMFRSDMFYVQHWLLTSSKIQNFISSTITGKLVI